MKSAVFGSLLLFGAGIAFADDVAYTDAQLRVIYNSAVRYVSDMTFPSLVVGDVDNGRAVFGVNANDTAVDTSKALFEGQSVIYGKVISNGTACATCHRPENNFLLPPLPLSAHVAKNDVLFTGRDSEAQGDPRQEPLFDKLGLLKIRPNRFNVSIPESSPFRQYFGWRKTQTILNMAFNFGLLTDGRARGVVEQARGAAFNHTQNTDVRFDDLVNPRLNDIGAYMQSEIQPAILKDLLDPKSANYQSLVNDPFFSVHASTALEIKGQRLFTDNCMGCHNTPNVFGNRDHVPTNGPNFPMPTGHLFDIGVSQRNANNLDFRFFDNQNASYSTIVMPLARQDGATIQWSITDDIGLAANTGRYEDLHKFKVPQLRNIAKLGPYFHDNSAATLEDVVDYFNSDDYNDSADGSQYPIHLNQKEREALVAFLQIL